MVMADIRLGPGVSSDPQSPPQQNDLNWKSTSETNDINEKDSKSGTVTPTLDTATQTLVHSLAPSIAGSSSATDIASLSSDKKHDEKHDEQPAFDLEAAVPDKISGKYRRGIRYRALIVYRRLFSVMGIINIGVAIAVILTGFSREWFGTITAMNVTLAVIMRQEFVVNALYRTFCSVPLSWPFWLRARLAHIYHFGGVHSGAGVSAALWLLAANIGDVVCMTTGSCSGTWGRLSIAGKTLSWIIMALFIAMLTMAYPSMRRMYHNSFEATHRFAGWTILALFWSQTVVSANDSRGPGVSLGRACVETPTFWLLVVSTLSVASSWFWLRKVEVESEVLSDHVVRLHFDYTVPVHGAFTRMSTNPLFEWHSFAVIPAPEAENGRKVGYSVLVSNAGDWTKRTIQEPPNRLWVRGVPVCGVMHVVASFRSVVLIATGSGIGPMLGQIQRPCCPTKFIWSTKEPEKTYGKPLCDLVKQKIPDAVIHDTRVSGRPDLVKMGYNMATSSGAEAVIIIANEKITKKVVYGLEARGIHAYGAIWDS
ncbi:hypothetical protein B0I35DRAFT_485150 [Stachybotrys elegans]|uniref:AMP-dependent synthetase/ligase domain-containing protein n=1 Tax=Stachybotrys elegans TaxID=80388 RepID=A0A8K0SGJ3_9HYPO|nr:hypothetical protein B0I35DRAFT_485150 [Stachybotrys elegans]